MFETTFNTCYELGKDYHVMAYYSHLVPLFISTLIGLYIFVKTKFSFLSSLFLSFILVFCLWLIGDLVTWTSSNYYLISFWWSLLDFINIIFFILVAFFYVSLVQKKDISIYVKMFLIVLSIPAFVITAMGNSIADFYQPVCEALENNYLTIYKLVVEALCLILIIYCGAVRYKKAQKMEKMQITTVGISLIFFLVIFAGTEYIATITNVYQINLYSLFILPIFFLVIIFSVTSLKLFDLKVLGTQLLLYVLIIMIGSQFFFIQGSANKVLNTIAFIVSIGFSFMLFRSVRKEIEIREQVEKLADQLQEANVRLRELDQQKTEFVSFATHQLRSPLTAMKGYTSLILEGDYGPISNDMKEAIERIYESSNTLANVVDDYLNISRIELGTMKYNFVSLDLAAMVREVINELKPNTDKAGVTMTFECDNNILYKTMADPDKLKQVIGNIIDNSVKYCPKGTVRVSLAKDDSKKSLLFAVKDNGIGISPEILPKLFQKFKRANNANETNIRGTGLGLYVAKEIVVAHSGKIWAESEGEGKGSQFYVELKAE
jgi:signal transduction histidine kinase